MGQLTSKLKQLSKTRLVIGRTLHDVRGQDGVDVRAHALLLQLFLYTVAYLVDDIIWQRTLTADT